MRISVVTVCFNAAATIARTLQSVARQTHPDIQHIVIDNASTDGTIEIVMSHADAISAIVSEPDQGIYDAMNKGLALAEGDIVTFLNADDVYAAEDILARVAARMADPALDACHADLIYVSKKKPERVVRYWQSRPFTPGLCLRGWMPAHPTFFVRKRVLDQHGGFDLDFRLQADFELMVRLFELHHIRSLYVPELWVRMRMGGASNASISNIWSGNLEALQACRKNGFALSPWFVARKILSRLPQFLVAFKPRQALR